MMKSNSTASGARLNRLQLTIIALASYKLVRIEEMTNLSYVLSVNRRYGLAQQLLLHWEPFVAISRCWRQMFSGLCCCCTFQGQLSTLSLKYLRQWINIDTTFQTSKKERPKPFILDLSFLSHYSYNIICFYHSFVLFTQKPRLQKVQNVHDAKSSKNNFYKKEDIIFYIAQN